MTKTSQKGLKKNYKPYVKLKIIIMKRLFSILSLLLVITGYTVYASCSGGLVTGTPGTCVQEEPTWNGADFYVNDGVSWFWIGSAGEWVPGMQWCDTSTLGGDCGVPLHPE